MRSVLLAEYLERNKLRGFEMGVWDCAQFCAQWIYELTGKDHRLLFPAYAAESFQSVLDANGGLRALVGSVLEEIHPSRATKGDLVLSDKVGGALGICVGVYSAHVGMSRIIYHNTLEATAAWRVE